MKLPIILIIAGFATMYSTHDHLVEFAAVAGILLYLMRLASHPPIKRYEWWRKL